ncbi:MAG: tail fiber protein [Spirulina sp. SIO3F2]|nr:tail fiber protein [Spirulina sp. SIO3F2]
MSTTIKQDVPKTTNFLSFGLRDFYQNTDQNILYINDKPENLKFDLEIRNQSESNIVLNAIQSDSINNPDKNDNLDKKNPNENNFHIELKFRPGQLAEASLISLDLSGVSKEQWNMSRPITNRDRTISIFLLKKNENLLLEAKKTKAVLTFMGLAASPLEGSRATQLEINPKNFYLEGDKDQKIEEKYLVILTILNYSGERKADDLVVTFAYNPIVLNDGSEQKITILLVNVGEEPIAFNEKTEFLITIDVESDVEDAISEPWALAKKDEIKNLTVTIKDQELSDITAQWKSDKSLDSKDPIYKLKPKISSEDTKLKKDEELLIELSNFKTTLPSGIGTIYFSWYNLPGYMDERRILSLRKTCITEQSGRIGINKFPDEGVALDVEGKIAANSFQVKNIGINKFPDEDIALDVEGKIATDSLQVKNIGINKLPDEGIALDVEGNVCISGVITGTPNDYEKAQFNLSGGGTVSWDIISWEQGNKKGKLKWTERFIAISMGRNNTFQSGHIEIIVPKQIPGSCVYSGESNRVTNDDEIILKAWEALYAVHEVGGNKSAITFQIQRYTKESFHIPSNWLLIAVVNGDDKTLKLGTGLTLSANASFSHGSPIPVGTIMMWSGSVDSIPGGWALCDGKDDRTPDLTDRFIVGAGKKYSPKDIGDGDKHQHELKGLHDQVKFSHSHDLKTCDKTEQYIYKNKFSDEDTYKNKKDKMFKIFLPSLSVTGPPRNEATIPIDFSDKNTDSYDGELRPRWYALCFIMKT